MNRVLALAGPIPGAGKTTAAVHLAQALSWAGQSALVVDLSGTGAVTRCLGVAEGNSGLLSRIIKGEENYSKIGLLVRSVEAGLDIVPGDVTLKTDGGFEALPGRLAEALDVLRPEYHWILLDTPTDVLLSQDGRLDVADALLYPVLPDAASIDAVRRFALAIHAHRQGRDPDVDRFFISESSMSLDVQEGDDPRRSLETLFPGQVLRTQIPHDPRLALHGGHVRDAAFESRALRAYVELAKEVMKYGRA